MAPKQATKTCSNMRHTKLVYKDYTTSVLCMQGMIKTTKNSGMPTQNNPNYKLRTSLTTMLTHEVIKTSIEDTRRGDSLLIRTPKPPFHH